MAHADAVELLHILVRAASVAGVLTEIGRTSPVPFTLPHVASSFRTTLLRGPSVLYSPTQILRALLLLIRADCIPSPLRSALAPCSDARRASFRQPRQIDLPSVLMFSAAITLCSGFARTHARRRTLDAPLPKPTAGHTQHSRASSFKTRSQQRGTQRYPGRANRTRPPTSRNMPGGYHIRARVPAAHTSAIALPYPASPSLVPASVLRCAERD